MSKASFLLLVILITSSTALPQITRQEEFQLENFQNGNNSCKSWLEQCHVTSQCCRSLECAFYHGKCVPKYGPKVVGADTRPLGDRYPPNFQP